MHPSSVLGGLHSDDSQSGATTSSNADLSISSDRVLLDVDNEELAIVVASVSRDPSVELTLSQTRLQSARAAQSATTADVSQPLSVTEIPDSLPHNQGDSDVAHDHTAPIPDEEFHMPVEQLDHTRWAEEQSKDPTCKATVAYIKQGRPDLFRHISCEEWVHTQPLLRTKCFPLPSQVTV